MSLKIVDACCLINIYAADDTESISILEAFGGELYVPDVVVQQEALYVRRKDDDDESKLIPEAVDLSPALQAGLIQECSIEGEAEAEGFVEFSVELDDGEAACLAIAKCRGWTVATDDRKATRIAAEHGVSTITTPELIKKWSDDSGVTDEIVAKVLQDIQLFARFVPRRSSPLREWWITAVEKHTT